MAFAGILAQALRPSETSRFSLRPLYKTVLLKLWDRASLVGQGVAKGGTRITWGGKKMKSNKVHWIWLHSLFKINTYFFWCPFANFMILFTDPSGSKQKQHHAHKTQLGSFLWVIVNKNDAAWAMNCLQSLKWARPEYCSFWRTVLSINIYYISVSGKIIQKLLPVNLLVAHCGGWV